MRKVEMMQHKILVTGATGTVGGLLVKQLVAAGHQVAALTRNAARANFPAGVEVVVGDLASPESLAPAFEGITGLHLINFDGATFSSLQSGAEIVALAKEAGVQRVTLLLGGEKGSVQEALEASDLCWTYIQPLEFMSNMVEWADSICAEGVVREPYGHRRTAIVHEADIAAVAAVALVEEGHGGKSYTISGPEVMTPPKMVAAIGKAIGRELKFVELSEAQAIARWQEAGFSDEVIEFFRWVHGNTPELGYTVQPTVEEVTGRPARTFAQWAEEHADLFRTKEIVF
jgi:uncharacterized protein YbjT (DUF2867 family)